MVQRRRPRAGRRRGGILGALGFAALLVLMYFAEPLGLGEWLDGLLGREALPVSAIAELPAEGLAVSYIDVGQGDATLIVCNGEAMLIDAGVPEEGQTVVDSLTASGVDSLVYAAVTHAHDDHCGGMDEVVEAVDIGTLFAPYTEYGSSGAFTYFEDAAAEQGLYVTVPTIGSTFTLGGAAVSFVGPVGDWGDDLNDSSLIIRVDYGERSFLFPGDASDGVIEDSAYIGGYDLDCDVLKLGHHGSSTSTSDAFLKAVSPAFAVISCGEGNSYGHPHKETLEKLEAAGIQVLRTDLLGDITAQWGEDGVTWAYSRNSAAELP